MTRQRWISVLVGGALLALGQACDHDEWVSVRADLAYRCPTWQCGYNSPELHGNTIRALNLEGLPNDDGARLIGFSAPPWAKGAYTLEVQGDELVGVAKNAPELRGADLVGSRLHLVVDGAVRDVRVDEVRLDASWAPAGAPVVSYRLRIQSLEAPGEFAELCTAGEKSEDNAYTVVLGGERYDEASIAVVPAAGWFSFACGTTALAKAAHLGYGPQTPFPGEGAPASPGRRQATLKMLTADFCGVGHAYTEDGVFLLYANQSGAFGPLPDVVPGDLEAIWTADGALCLEATRLGTKVNLCDLPSCDGLGLGDGEWITHLP